MDEITRRVQALYRRLPYPNSGGWQLRADSFPDWLLAQVDREPYPRKVRLLDLGCGTGAALVPIAAMHPEAEVVGLDLSEASLEIAGQNGANLQNLTLLQGDLLDEASVEALLALAPGGFDVIWCSGVLHHLSDPDRGLSHLRRLLAPDGVLSLMVYAHFGRLPVARLARAVQLIAGAEAPFEAREALTRDLLAALEGGSLTRPPWDDGLRLPPAELADRYLHPWARSYRVEELLSSLESHGLHMLRWLEPRAWSPAATLGPGPAAEALDALPPRERWTALEQLLDHPGLELLVTHGDRAERPALNPQAHPELLLDWNPQAAVRVAERRLSTGRFPERVEARLRAGPYVELRGLDALIAQIIQGPTPAQTLVQEALARLPIQEDEAWATLTRLMQEEWIFAPSEP